jgi:hypothetical protein
MKFYSQEYTDIEFISDFIRSCKNKSFEDVLKKLYPLVSNNFVFSQKEQSLYYHDRINISKDNFDEKIHSIIEESNNWCLVQVTEKINFSDLRNDTIKSLIEYLDSIFEWLYDLRLVKYEREQIYAEILEVFHKAIKYSLKNTQQAASVIFMKEFGIRLLNKFEEIYYSNPRYKKFKCFVKRIDSGINPTNFCIKRPTQQKAKLIYDFFDNNFLITKRTKQKSIFEFIQGNYPSSPIDWDGSKKLKYLFSFIEHFNQDTLLYEKKGFPYKRCNGIFTCSGKDLPTNWNRQNHNMSKDRTFYGIKELIEKLENI